MSSNTCEKNVISVWFVCGSCEFTFPFRTVDEFLDHKKDEHFSEFQNTHCIVLEERKEINDPTDDENNKNQNVEIKLFTEDDRDIPFELRDNPNTIFSLVAESPVPVLPKLIATNSSETPNPLREKESELNYADFGLFSVRSWSSDHNPEDDLCDLELEVGENMSPSINEAASQNQSQLVHVGSTVKENIPMVILHKNWRPDFSLTNSNTYAIHEGDDDETKFEVDTIDNFENNSFTSKNPYVLLCRLTPKELRSFNPKYSCSNKRRLKAPRSDMDASQNQSNPLTLTQTPLGLCNSSDPGTVSNNNVIRLDPDVPEVGVSVTVQGTIAENSVKCGLCGKNLSSEAKAKVHVTRCWFRNKSKNCYCAPCNKTLSSPQALKHHIRVKHIEGRKRSTKTIAKRNPPAVKPVKPVEYRCHTCSRTFNRASGLKFHLETHVPLEQRERLFVCEICGKAFSKVSHLTNHLKCHGQERPFKCPHPECTSAYKINAHLATHLETHAQGLFTCPKDGCSKRFKTKKNLSEHLKSLRHTGVYKPKTWRCSQKNCDKLYLLQVSLNLHMIVAHGIGGELPTFECDICKKTFTWKISLTKHYQTHTEDRPFKCSYEGCDKAYKDKGALVQHVHGKHTGERPYQCELCGKAYYLRGSLIWHMGIHQKSKQSGLKK